MGPKGQDTINVKQDVDPTNNILVGGGAPDKEAMGEDPIRDEEQDVVGARKEAKKEAAN